MQANLRTSLHDHKIKEVKFQEIGTHRPKIDAPLDFLGYAVDFAGQGKIRIEILVWDIYDSRHAIQGRDDIANLERMYYRILVWAARQWNHAEWNFFPDQNSQINWGDIARYLNRTQLARAKPNVLQLFESEDGGHGVNP